jgi:hypothetical protein
MRREKDRKKDVINSMELSPSWGTANRSAIQQFPNPKAHYRIYKSLPEPISYSFSLA